MKTIENMSADARTSQEQLLFEGISIGKSCEHKGESGTPTRCKEPLVCSYELPLFSYTSYSFPTCSYGSRTSKQHVVVSLSPLSVGGRANPPKSHQTPHTDTHTDTHTHIQTDTDTNTHTHTYSHRHTDTDTQTHTHTHTQTDTQTHRHTDIQTHTQTHRHTDTQTHRHTDIQTHTHTHRTHGLRYGARSRGCLRKMRQVSCKQRRIQC